MPRPGQPEAAPARPSAPDWQPTRRRDPFTFLQAHRGEPRILLATPGLTLAGAGIAAEIVASGPQRFLQAGQQAAAQARRLGLGPSDAGLHWLGGFAFDADDPSDPPFPPLRFILPKLLLRLRSGEAHELQVGATPSAPPMNSSPAASLAPWTQDPGPEEWTLRVREALREVQAGRLDKLVLARRLRARGTPPDAVAVARRLQEENPTSTIFLFEPQPGHAWVGASPELLVRREEGRVASVALAGSRPRGATPAEDEAYERSLVASSKDAWEHELVCRAIRQALEERGRPWQMRIDRAILKLPHVQHLETRFESATTPDEHLLDLAARLHPTPAVCGGPREAAKAWIQRLEGRPRGWYAGGIGFFDGRGDGSLHVAIRSARLRPDEAILFAGCGIVNGSDPAEEWEESRTKFQTLRQALEAHP